MASFFKMMRAKKKRAVNPDLPRPNLFSHEKSIKEAKSTIDTLSETVLRLTARVEELERKLTIQNQQLTNLNQQKNIFRRG